MKTYYLRPPFLPFVFDLSFVFDSLFVGFLYCSVRLLVPLFDGRVTSEGFVCGRLVSGRLGLFDSGRFEPGLLDSGRLGRLDSGRFEPGRLGLFGRFG